METILIVNAGSSSLKFHLYALEQKPFHEDLVFPNKTNLHQTSWVLGPSLANGLVERIGAVDAKCHFQKANSTLESEVLEIPDGERAFSLVLRWLLQKETGILKTRAEVALVGHRVVHGGDRFVSPALVSSEVKAEIQVCSQFAPLHNPTNLQGISLCEKMFPAAKHVAVFDTAFHSTLPPKAFLYPLPHILYERHRIRRYGFHGTSHKYVSIMAMNWLRAKGMACEKIIVCHLGNGASVCAIHKGRSVDTSMGFTPLEGLMMGTRSGDVDPGVLLELIRREGMGADEVERLFNQYSGFRGVTEDTSDVRTVIEKAQMGYEQHQTALEMFCYRIQKYIGAYTAVLGGVDALIFTGGVGQNASQVRAAVTEPLGYLGITIDDKLNLEKNPPIHPIGSGRCQVLVISTDEEKMIAMESVDVVNAYIENQVDGILLDESDQLLLVKLWNQVAGNSEELIEVFFGKTGKLLSAESLTQQLEVLGIRNVK